MGFVEQIREFIGHSTGEEEARAIAASVVAANVRALKLAIGERIWLARQRAAAGDQAGSAQRLAEARGLQVEYTRALEEFQRVAPGQTGGGPDDGTRVPAAGAGVVG